MCVCVCVCKHMYTCVCTCIHSQVWACVFVCLCLPPPMCRLHLRVDGCVWDTIHMHTHTHVNMCTYMCECTCVCVTPYSTGVLVWSVVCTTGGVRVSFMCAAVFGKAHTERIHTQHPTGRHGAPSSSPLELSPPTISYEFIWRR